jgi:transcriptional regulator with XRE-family HTH domain
VSEDWAAVAEAINERVTELGWRQRELAERSHVSPAIVREIQRQTVERRRSPRTLESLSIALGWEPQHLDAVLKGHELPASSKHVNGSRETTSSRLDAIERRLGEITEVLADIKTDITTVIEHVGNRG